MCQKKGHIPPLIGVSPRQEAVSIVDLPVQRNHGENARVLLDFALNPDTERGDERVREPDLQLSHQPGCDPASV